MNEQIDSTNAVNSEAKGIAGVLGNPEGVIRQICASRRLDARRQCLCVDGGVGRGGKAWISRSLGSRLCRDGFGFKTSAGNGSGRALLHHLCRSDERDA